MIVVRDVFQLRFGAAKEVRALLAERSRIWERSGGSAQRYLADLTGRYYTLVVESTFDDLASWDTAMKTFRCADGWRPWFERFSPLVESGHREIYTVIEP